MSTDWYQDLANVKLYLCSIQPELQYVFDEVDASGFQLHTVIKPPYPALIAAIIGQMIRYQSAKIMRSRLYERFGNDFLPEDLHGIHLDFLDVRTNAIIQRVTVHIIEHGIDLSTEAGIRSLKCVPGIGEWTLQTTLLTTLYNWDLFPPGDKFLIHRLRKIFGEKYDVKMSSRWSPYRSVVTWYLWRWFPDQR